MSGFEIVGVVLGAFPLALEALDRYREMAQVLGLFLKFRVEHKRWRDDLEFHQLTFKMHLKQLLLPLEVGDDNKITKLLAAPGGDEWKETAIAESLERRLGDSYELYLEYVKGVGRVMDEVNRELAIDTVTVQRLDNPKISTNTSRLKTAFSKEGRDFLRYKIKFSINEVVRKRLFQELQDYSQKLEKLVDSSDKNTLLVQQRTGGAALAALDAAICNFWVQARRVFKALASAWNCGCLQHDAKLLLQHRTSKQLEFQVMFTTMIPSSHWEIRKTRICEGDDLVAASTPLENVPFREPGHRKNPPKKSAFRTQTKSAEVALLRSPPSVTLATAESSPHVNISFPISNLCASLKQQEAEGSCCGYLSDHDYRYYVYIISHQSMPGQTLSSVTLDQILRGDSLPEPTRTQRYTLSLTLASSFLQLLDSPWMPTSFKKTDILFMPDPNDSNVFLLDQPHINRNLLTTSATNAPEFKFSDALDHLGVLLLELCFGRTLESHSCRKRWPAGNTPQEKAGFDVMAARDWQRLVNEEAGPDYADAVAWCLGGNRSSPVDRWRKDMLRQVVGPLVRCLDYLRG